VLLVEVTCNECTPVVVGVNEYTFSSPGVANPHEPGLQTPAPVVVAVTPVAQANTGIDKQGSGPPPPQLVHWTVVVRQAKSVPQPALLLQCGYTVPVKVVANVSGVCPKANTAPPGVPERTVIQSVPTLDVNLSVWPATAPVTVAYSPPKLQVEMVTTAPVGLMAPLPKEDAKLHWLQPTCPTNNIKGSINQ